MRALIVLLLVVSTAAAEKLRIAVFGDRTGGANQEVFERLVAQADRMRPDLLVNVGDNIEGYTSDMDEARAQWKQVKETYARMSCPVYICPGNHDIWDDDSEKLFLDETGHHPNYSFDVGDVHFTIFDNSRTEKFSEIPEAYVKWLKDDLAKAQGARQRFVFFHKPFWYNGAASGHEDGLHEIFKAQKVTRVFTGHYHSFCYKEVDGLPYHIAGSCGGGNSGVRARGDFFGFLWVTVDGDRVDVATIGLDGVMAQDVVSFEQREMVNHIQGDTLSLPTVDLPQAEGPAEVTVQAAYSPVEKDRAGEGTWDTQGTQWTADPPKAEMHGAQTFRLKVKDARSPFPLPTLRMTYRYQDRWDIPLEATLAIRRIAKVVHVDKPPDIDGALDDACWNDESRLGQLSEVHGWGAGPGETQVWIVRDDAKLYLAARCDDKEPKKIRALCKQRKSMAIITDDAIGIAIDPTNERKWAYQVMVNAAGAVLDMKTTWPATGMYRDLRWTAPWETKTARTETGWTIELSVPIDALQPEKERELTPWAFNVGRYCPRMHGILAWQPSTTPHPRTYGTLLLK